MKEWGLMERINDWAKVRLAKTAPDSEVKWQIYEKLRKRMSELQDDDADVAICPELNPDVIVISADQSLLFEAQNLRASEWLHQRCGSGKENVQMRGQIRVHPCECRKIIDDLKTAGFAVVC